MLFVFIAFGFTLCGAALLGTRLFIAATDFGQMYSKAYKNSLWVFQFCIHHPLTAKYMQLEAFQWSGIAANAVIAVQGIMTAAAILLSVILKNVFITVPLFLLFREAFIIAAMFRIQRRKDAESAGLENMLRLFLTEVNQTNSRRESLGRITEKLAGIWRDSVGRLFRKLGNGNDNSVHYAEFAETFPTNNHVRLFAQLLNYSDLYGGDIKDALTRIIQDVMQDRLEDEKNKSETSATFSIILLINLGVVAIASFNLITSPLVVDILVSTFTGKLLLAVAALCCFLSLNTTRKIVEE